MTTLIALLSIGKGSWAEVVKLINAEEWEKILLVTNDFGKEKFTSPKEAISELIVIDNRNPEKEMAEDIRKGLEGKVSGTEVALNMTSGTGKEHMALLQAVLNLGMGLRLVTIEKDKLTVL